MPPSTADGPWHHGGGGGPHGAGGPPPAIAADGPRPHGVSGSGQHSAEIRDAKAKKTGGNSWNNLLFIIVW